MISFAVLYGVGVPCKLLWRNLTGRIFWTATALQCCMVVFHLKVKIMWADGFNRSIYVQL